MWRSITEEGTAWTKRLAEAGETVENEGALRSKSRHERSTKQLRLKTYDALKLGPLNRSHLINVQRSSDKVESLGHIGNYLFCQRLRTHVSKQASRFGFSKDILTSIKGTDALIFQLLRLRSRWWQKCEKKSCGRSVALHFRGIPGIASRKAETVNNTIKMLIFLLLFSPRFLLQFVCIFVPGINRVGENCIDLTFELYPKGTLPSSDNNSLGCSDWLLILVLKRNTWLYAKAEFLLAKLGTYDVGISIFRHYFGPN